MNFSYAFCYLELSLFKSHSMMIYDTNRLAQLIRQVDQHNQLGPVALADALMPIIAERFEEELDRRAAHAHDALMWVATALAAVGHEDKAIIMEGRSRTVKDILEEATTVLSSDDAAPLGALCARIHVRSTDTYPELSVEVVDGSHLQPSDSPIHVYALPPAKQLVLHGAADLPSLRHPDAWLLTRASGTRWAVTEEPTQEARAVYEADNVTIDELVLRRNVMLSPTAERKLFETWARTVFDADKLARAPWPHDEEYAWSSAQYAWQIWQVLRKLPALATTCEVPGSQNGAPTSVGMTAAPPDGQSLGASYEALRNVIEAKIASLGDDKFARSSVTVAARGALQKVFPSLWRQGYRTFQTNCEALQVSPAQMASAVTVLDNTFAIPDAPATHVGSLGKGRLTIRGKGLYFEMDAAAAMLAFFYEASGDEGRWTVAVTSEGQTYLAEHGMRRPSVSMSHTKSETAALKALERIATQHFGVKLERVAQLPA
ncbi:hypothetical protein [Achromobacter sp. 2789STDY5608633]|uniref:hypothetical protein n=1 Tax=Achromobacter sp. 2789STDY5608633 TaxID=1806501 RepID=UPI0012E134B2|nr:hypothetical protein [Achromobacter sp. 2789STDY5608633]